MHIMKNIIAFIIENNVRILLYLIIIGYSNKKDCDKF